MDNSSPELPLSSSGASNDSPHYQKQHRGDAKAYEKYFAGMNASMQQKVALTTAHFPTRGRIADMGSGSGRGTFDLASLYHGLDLVGVDINPISVEIAAEKYTRSNLSYVVGDIAENVFPPESLEGILDSSVLHHVTSFNSFDVNRVYRTLDNQVTQLKEAGVIIIRDFVIPDGPDEVFLDLPSTDGLTSGSVSELSTAALFERFAKEWRSSTTTDEGVHFSKTGSPYSDHSRFKLSLRTATEFVLRKDYRADWDTEVLEEYTYLSQAQFESEFRKRGLRIVTSVPIWNPWIVENRFEGKFYLADLKEKPLPFPPTNYLIVGEKVSAESGVELIEENCRESETPNFLNLSIHRNIETGAFFELVDRPNQTIDLLPWFKDEGQLFIIAKKDFPRPIINASATVPRLNSSTFSGYITEPISAIVSTHDLSDESVNHILAERGGFTDDQIVGIADPFTYYTSPGGINERVLSRLVEVTPKTEFSTRFPNYTPFKDAGTVRSLDALQVLRSCHVGGMFDARLEINIYRLLRTLRQGAGPWIGAPIHLRTQEVDKELKTVESSLSPRPRAVFETVIENRELKFLSVREGTFVERTQSQATLSTAAFEYVIPRILSPNTLVALPILKTSNGIFVGVEHRDLPAIQTFSGSSVIATSPAWRLPSTVTHTSQLPKFVEEAMQRDFGVLVLKSWELGGCYFPSPGVTPETVFPFVVEVDHSSLESSTLLFTSLEELVTNIELIQDAHLAVAANRLIHALGFNTQQQ